MERARSRLGVPLAFLILAELYRAQPDQRLLSQSERALDFMLRHDGMHITGGRGQCEIWTDDQDGRGDLGETCATAYQLRVYDSLLRLRGEARLGDLIERTIFNALFAAQSPDGRRPRYFAPTEGPRADWTTDTYCCPCNHRRIVAELPAMVCYRTQAGLALNLYAPAQAKLSVTGDVTLVVRQETDYPDSGRLLLRLDPSRPVTFPLQLRVPTWAQDVTVSVNGPALPMRGICWDSWRKTSGRPGAASWSADAPAPCSCTTRWRQSPGSAFESGGRVLPVRSWPSWYRPCVEFVRNLVGP